MLGRNMAVIGKNPDGTYATECALCGETLSEPIFATSHFIGDKSHDLYRFSDAAMHWSCYLQWPDQARFASLYFETCVKVAQIRRWPQYWPILLKSRDVLVLYGVAVDEIAVVLRRSGTEIRIARDEWQPFLDGKWREMCLAGLECEAAAAVLSDLAQLTLPQPGASPNGGPAERLGNSGAGGGPPSVS
jgi:hypothetical protein